MINTEAHPALLLRHSSSKEKAEALKGLVLAVQGIAVHGIPSNWNLQRLLEYIDEVSTLRASCYEADPVADKKLQEALEAVCDKYYRNIGSAA